MTVPVLYDRNLPYVSASWRDIPGTSQHEVRGHKTLMGAFTSSVEMFKVRRGGYYKSKTPRLKPQGCQDESRRGITGFQIELNDFVDPLLPKNDEFLFLKVEDFNLKTQLFTTDAPILIVPPPSVFRNPNPTFSTYGEAPDISAVEGTTPQDNPGTLSIFLPLFANSLLIKNLSGASDLMVSYGKTMPFVPFLSGQPSVEIPGSPSEIYFASSGAATCPFSIISTLKGV